MMQEERCLRCGMLLINRNTEQTWVFYGEMKKLCIFCKPMESYTTDML